ncbi:MAG: hydroxyacid dehydrogenase [Clostridia bacterium]|nr:hydroxyacid dehydrogenase [Clostridia bacterium]
MKIVILDRDTLGSDADLQPLRQLGETVEYGSTPVELVHERLVGADVAVVNKIRLNGSNLPGTGLQLICVAATGYDNIDLEVCRTLGIALYNVPGYSTESVAQITAAMVLSLVNHLQEYRNYVHSGDYSRSGVANRVTPTYHELSSLTWGVVGGGGIGGRVAEIARSLGCRVLMHRRKPDDRFTQVDMDTLCRESDIVSLHVPLTPDTRGMLSRTRIATMKPGAIVVNVARGAVADETALADAVRSGQLGGLGIDVYATEPLTDDHPYQQILDLPNVCLTPHMAWGALEARNRCVAIMGDNIERFFCGSLRNRIV